MNKTISLLRNELDMMRSKSVQLMRENKELKQEFYKECEKNGVMQAKMVNANNAINMAMRGMEYIGSQDAFINYDDVECIKEALSKYKKEQDQ